MARHVRSGLDLAAEALLDGRPVPEEAQAGGPTAAVKGAVSYSQLY